MRQKKRDTSYSKQLISDIRPLLWIVTLAALGLAYICVFRGYTGVDWFLL